MTSLWRMIAVATVVDVASGRALPDEPPPHLLMAAVVKSHCAACHSGKNAEGDLDLDRLTQAPMRDRDFRTWERVVRSLSAGEMPPKSAKELPTPEREKVVAALRTALAAIARRHDGDPGPAVVRRLTNDEYENAIRDLTGLSLRVSDRFPRDGSGGEGFTNSGGMLTIASAGMFERYLAAAREIADHAWITPGRRLHFRPIPAKSDSVAIRRRELEAEIAALYAAASSRARLDKALVVCWTYRHRKSFGNADLATLTKAYPLDPRYVAWVWDQLHDPSAGFVQRSALTEPWSKLPEPGTDIKADTKSVEARCSAIAARAQSSLHEPIRQREIGSLRNGVFFEFDPRKVGEPYVWTTNLGAPKGPNGDAAVYVSIANAGLHQPGLLAVVRRPRIVVAPKDERVFSKLLAEAGIVAPHVEFGRHPRGGTITADDFVVPVPSVVKLPIPKEVFLDDSGRPRPFVSPMLAIHLDSATPGTIQIAVSTTPPADAGGAGDRPEPGSFHPTGVFHGTSPEIWDAVWASYDDYFRRFALPHYPLAAHFGLSDKVAGRPEELMVLYGIPPERHLHRFAERDAWLERCLLAREEKERLDVLWTDLMHLVDEPAQRLARFVDYHRLPKPEDAGFAEALGALPTRTDKPAADSRRSYVRIPPEPAKRHAELAADARAAAADDLSELVFAELQGFARRAWRRPLSDEEKANQRRLYEEVRAAGRSEQESARTVLLGVLTSSRFLYKVEVSKPGRSIHPITQHELAARLGFFLWSSIPDETLLGLADEGRLQDAAVDEQVRRMLADPRAEALATEFFGQWLGFKGFDRHTRPDPGKFPEFTPELRQAMLDEAVLFVRDLVREDRPVTDLVFAADGYLNLRLAVHYGIDPAAVAWPPAAAALYRNPGAVARLGNDPALKQPLYRVPVEKHGRGGVLALGSILAGTSTPFRTSPSVRGKWLYESILGRQIPPPPADAGTIREDEASRKGKTMRQLLEAHRRQASCAGCHARFDPLGFALEGFDAIGRRRLPPPGGEPVDDLAEIDGTSFRGIEGLKAYVRDHRDEFVRNFSRKLLGFALERSVLPSDGPLVDRMVAAAAAKDLRFSALLEAIVSSRQFRHRRGDGFVDPLESE